MKAEFLADVKTSVTMEDIPHDLILNWDQPGIKLVEMVGVGDKRQITAVFCGNALGEFLPGQLVDL